MGLGFCDKFCSTKLGGRKALKINCPNCAAPIEPELNKCPYCELLILIWAVLILKTKSLFYLKIKTKYKGFDYYITQFVKPKLTTIEQSYSTNDITGGRGNLTILRETFEKDWQ